MRRGEAGVEARKISKLEQRAHQNKTYRRHKEDAWSRQEDARQDDGNQIEREVVAVEVTGHVHDGGDDRNVGKDLQVGLKQIVPAELVVDQEKQIEDVPQDDRKPQSFNRGEIRVRSQHADAEFNGEHEGDEKETDLDHPGYPAAQVTCELHGSGCSHYRNGNSTRQDS